MRYLLDTHTFVWLDSDSSQLPAKAHSIIAESDNNVFLSLVSVWEMQIKARLGKLNLRVPLENIIRDQQQTNAVQLLPIMLDHILALDNLPNHHKDPFDRLLIAQAQVEQMSLITKDPQIAQYPVTVVW